MIKETVVCVLFWASLISEQTQKIYSRVEVKNVTGYAFEEVVGKREYERVENITKYSLRVQKSFPKDASEPILEAIRWNIFGSYVKYYPNPKAMVFPQKRRLDYTHSVELNGIEVFFNLK